MDMQITYLLNKVNLLYRRCNSLYDFIDDWPITWNEEDIAAAKNQSIFDGTSVDILIGRLFAEDLQLTVAFTTTTSWVLQQYQSST
jgi:hypothetical protein